MEPMRLCTSKRAEALFAAMALLGLAVMMISCAPIQDQPTKEVNLNSDLDVKQKPLQEDIDQFFRDQEHLLAKRNETAGTSSGWLPTLPINFSELVGDVISLNQLSQILSQLGIPITIDPASIAIMIFKTPLDWVSGLSSFRLVNVTQPIMELNDRVIQKL